MYCLLLPAGTGSKGTVKSAFPRTNSLSFREVLGSSSYASPLFCSDGEAVHAGRTSWGQRGHPIPRTTSKSWFLWKGTCTCIVKGQAELPAYHVYLSSVCGSRPGIRDPVPFWSLEPGTGIGFSLIPDPKRFSGIQKSGTEYSGLWNK
jgi:hypothetical protein